MRFTRIFCFCTLLVFSIASMAQTKTRPAGHWEGNVTIPSMELKVLIDLDLDAGGQWIGDIDIPARNVTDMPLRGITVSGSAVSFSLPGSGAPKFQGKLSEDGNTLSGDFTQAANTFPFTLKWVGEAKVFVPPKSAALPEKFLGQWEGALEIPSGKLRTVFHLENKDGSATGSIDSPDQGTTGIPISEISATDNSIKITVRLVSGSYEGTLSEDGKVLTGKWTQGGNTLPLVLAKAAAKS